MEVGMTPSSGLLEITMPMVLPISSHLEQWRNQHTERSSVHRLDFCQKALGHPRRRLK